MAVRGECRSEVMRSEQQTGFPGSGAAAERTRSDVVSDAGEHLGSATGVNGQSEDLVDG